MTPLDLSQARQSARQEEYPPKSWQAPNKDYRAAKLRVLHPANWEGKEVPAKRWLVENLIPMGSVTMLNGDGGVGKSLLAMQLMIAASTGKQWLGVPTMRCKTFGLFCEDDDDELHRRTVDITKHYDLDLSSLEDVEMVSRVGCDNSLADFEQFTNKMVPSNFHIDLMNHVIESGAQLVVLDSLHDLFTGNENHRGHARQFISQLREVAMEINGAVVLNSHPSAAGLASGSGVSGSTAWSNSVRSRLYFTKPDVDPGEAETGSDAKRVLTTKKANYGPIAGEIEVTWKEGAFAIEQKGDWITESLGRKTAELAFLDLLHATEKEGRPVSDSSHAGNYAPKAFSMRTDRQGYGREDFRRAMERLFTDGRIKSVDYGRTGDRRKKLIHITQETGSI